MSSGVLSCNHSINSELFCAIKTEAIFSFSKMASKNGPTASTARE